MHHAAFQKPCEPFLKKGITSLINQKQIPRRRGIMQVSEWRNEGRSVLGLGALWCWRPSRPRIGSAYLSAGPALAEWGSLPLVLSLPPPTRPSPGSWHPSPATPCCHLESIISYSWSQVSMLMMSTGPRLKSFIFSKRKEWSKKGLLRTEKYLRLKRRNCCIIQQHTITYSCVILV